MFYGHKSTSVWKYIVWGTCSNGPHFEQIIVILSSSSDSSMMKKFQGFYWCIISFQSPRVRFTKYILRICPNVFGNFSNLQIYVCFEDIMREMPAWTDLNIKLNKQVDWMQNGIEWSFKMEWIISIEMNVRKLCKCTEMKKASHWWWWAVSQFISK